MMGNFKKTEIGLIPEDWEVVRLGDYIEESKEKNKTGDLFQVYTVSNIFGFVISDQFFDKKVYSDKLTTYKIVKNNYFAYNPYRVNVGSLALFGKENESGLVSPAYVVFKIKEEKHNSLDGQFLLLILKSPEYIQKIKNVSMSRGSVRRTLSYRDLTEFFIPIPSSAEQQKIANVLSTIQKAIEQQDKVIEAVRKLKKSLMQKLFTEGLYGEEQKETEIGPMPKSWEVVRLGEFFKLSSGKSRPKIIKDVPQSDSPFPVFGGNGIIGYSNNYLLTYSTLVIGRVGEYCGSIHIAPSYSWITDNALYVKEFLREDFDLSYLGAGLAILNLNRFKKKSGQPLITQGVIYEQKNPLPPLPEQKQIAHILSTVDKKIEAEQKRKTALKGLFKTMLHKLMTGEIRLRDMEI